MKKLCVCVYVCALLMMQATTYAESPEGNSKDINLGHRTVKVQESENDYSFLASSKEPLTDEEFALLNEHYNTKLQEKFENLHEKNVEGLPIRNQLSDPSFLIVCFVSLIVTFFLLKSKFKYTLPSFSG